MREERGRGKKKKEQKVENGFLFSYLVGCHRAAAAAGGREWVPGTKYRYSVQGRWTDNRPQGDMIEKGSSQWRRARQAFAFPAGDGFRRGTEEEKKNVSPLFCVNSPSSSIKL